MLLAVISFSDRWGRCGVCVQCVESTHFKIQFGCYKWFDNTHLKVIKWSSDNYICLFCWQNTANLVQSPIICLSSVVKHIFWPTASTCLCSTMANLTLTKMESDGKIIELQYIHGYWMIIVFMCYSSLLWMLPWYFYL